MGLVAGLLIAGTTLEVVGQIGAASAASAQAKGQQAISNYNARVAEQNARAAEIQAGFKGRQQALAADRQESTLLNQLGASGVSPTEGTPLLIQTEQADQADLDQLMIGYQGVVAAQQQRSQAAIDKAQASLYGQQASAAMTAGYIGAGTSLLYGFGAYKLRNYNFDTPKTPAPTAQSTGYYGRY
jgi:hypothetical protein